MSWWKYRDRVTVIDVLEKGACYSGVCAWVAAKGVIAGDPANFAEEEIRTASQVDGGDGDVDGYGAGAGSYGAGGYGYGAGSYGAGGYGYGYSNGDGAGAYGYGYSNGDGADGYGSGYGYGYGYGGGGYSK